MRGPIRIGHGSRTCFRVFTDKLMRHEQTENELVQEVFTDDIGSKD